MIERVLELLRHYEEAGTFLQTPTNGPGENRGESDPPPLDAPPEIGPYRLVRRLGEGHYGEVFEAEQREPVTRRVAIKLLKRGVDSRETLARFQAERQAIASLDHPNISRFLDAGETDDGRPYFVMDLVRGLPILEYADTNHLSIRDRVRLMIDACRGVQHAHDAGLIHRDLKPGNILVEVRDDRATPRVIDFGIARAISGPMVGAVHGTAHGQLLGTPGYMSPEQATGQLDVDVRSDVYALGCVLYELLAGSTPIPRDDLLRLPLADMQRVVRECEVPLPSETLAGAGDQLRGIARRRGVESTRLPSLVSGELDWICARALSRDRSERYATAGELADDLRRWIEGRPVEAPAPGGASHRLARFANRHRRSLVGAVAVVAAVAFLGGWIPGVPGFLRSVQYLVDARSGEDRPTAQARQLNRIEGNHAFVGGGNENTAGPNHTVVAGGFGNAALGEYATIGGGGWHSAEGKFTTIAGGRQNRAVTPRSTIGGGVENLIEGVAGTIAGGEQNKVWAMGGAVGGGVGNEAKHPGAVIAGGRSNVAGPYAVVSGGAENRAIAIQSIVAGGYNNRATETQAVICGGDHNRADGSRSHVGGGFRNYAFNQLTTIGGGMDNRVGLDDGDKLQSDGSTISGGINNKAQWRQSTIGGGINNIATSDWATVAGGRGNTAGDGSRAGGTAATVAGGSRNRATGPNAAVPGGAGNLAAGNGAFAAGTRARATHDGAFVWSDLAGEQETPVESAGPNAFTARARGGFRFLSSLEAGPEIKPGEAGWSALLSADARTDTGPVDRAAVLESLAQLDIQTFRYADQTTEHRHIAPTAEQLHTLLGLGAGDGQVLATDLDGVALAAIQALLQRLEAQRAQLDDQARRIAELERHLAGG